MNTPIRILILGSKGLLGAELAEVFYDLSPYLIDRNTLDITNKKSIDAVFRDAKPDVVINAAAYTDVEAAQGNKELAMNVNGKALSYLTKAAKKQEAVVVHYSTDYVFSGEKQEGYDEGDKPSDKPLNVYGESKLLGEQELQENTDDFYIIRTSWLFGKHGNDFTDTVLRLAEKGEMSIKNDERGKPTYAKDLAQATRAIVLEGMPFGIYHIVNEIPTTWYEYAKEIVRIWGKLNDWEKSQYPKIIPVSSDKFPSSAKRPKNSILNNNKFIHLRTWQEALEEYLESLQ